QRNGRFDRSAQLRATDARIADALERHTEQAAVAEADGARVREHLDRAGGELVEQDGEAHEQTGGAAEHRSTEVQRGRDDSRGDPLSGDGDVEEVEGTGCRRR